MADGNGNGNGTNGKRLPEIEELRVRTRAARIDLEVATALSTSPRDRSSEVAQACRAAHFELRRIGETIEALSRRREELVAGRLLAAVRAIVDDVRSKLRLSDDSGIVDREEAAKHDAAIDGFASVLLDELRRLEDVRVEVPARVAGPVGPVGPLPPGGGDLLDLLADARHALRPGQASTAIADLVGRIDRALGAYQHPGA